MSLGKGTARAPSKPSVPFSLTADPHATKTTMLKLGFIIPLPFTALPHVHVSSMHYGAQTCQTHRFKLENHHENGLALNLPDPETPFFQCPSTMSSAQGGCLVTT